ncbi:NAD(P)-binding protein [Auricularia subglabra TFB-10046 SS5]|nr:NAD(P)-binding protein [Auricularia subglabra TFB-10046 SS5]
MSALSEAFAPKPKWIPSERVPDCSGKVFIVTGGNSGIGRETVLQLLKKGGKVYMASRDSTKAEEAIGKLEKETGRRAVFLELDLADLRSVKRAAEEFLKQETQLNVLFNNAGVMIPPTNLLTSDGYDLQFGTNVLGHHYFTKLLLPVLFATTEANPSDKARVITTSSFGHRGYTTINYNALRDTPERRKLGAWKLYSQSKFGNILVANELARRYGDKIISASLHPGGIRTNLQRYSGSLLLTLTSWMLAEEWMGAITQLYAGTETDGEKFNGKYLFPYGRIGKPNKAANVPEVGEKLWNWLEEQVKDL